MFDLTCNECGATYDVAESTTLEGDPSEFTCAVCGRLMTRLGAPRYRVCRMTLPAGRSDFHVPSEGLDRF